jgi:hypothetical protein
MYVGSDALALAPLTKTAHLLSRGRRLGGPRPSGVAIFDAQDTTR